MAETLNTLKARRSCRAYKPEPIEREKLDMEKEKASTGTGMDAEIWQLQEPEGEEMDG